MKKNNLHPSNCSFCSSQKLTTPNPQNTTPIAKKRKVEIAKSSTQSPRLHHDQTIKFSFVNFPMTISSNPLKIFSKL